MTLESAFGLVLVLCLLAAMPSSSVALVVARSALYGRRHGFAVAGGIVAGDLILMLSALLGMTALAEWAGTFFAVIKTAAGAYLIWFGLQLTRAKSTMASAAAGGSRSAWSETGLLTSFGAGLLLTLADVKAIFFYASLLPMFLDLTALTAVEICVISALTAVSVGAVKACYAVGGARLAQSAQGLFYEHQIRIVLSGVMIAAGTYLILMD